MVRVDRWSWAVAMIVVAAASIGARVAAAAALPEAVATPTATATVAATGLVRGAAPSFDCAKASALVEKTICHDLRLAALDRELAAALAKAMEGWPDAEQGRQRAAQRAWLATRDACGDERDVTRCLDDRYRLRIVEVQILGGQLEAPTPVAYVCRDHADLRLTAAFYDQTDPKSVVLTLGDRRTIATIQRAGSGARYAKDDVDFWEHHGEVTLEWSGVTYVCDPS